MSANLEEVKAEAVAATLGSSLMPPPGSFGLISSVSMINRDFLTSGRCIHLNLVLAAQIHGAVPDMRLPVFCSLCCSKGAGKDGILQSQLWLLEL